MPCYSSLESWPNRAADLPATALLTSVLLGDPDAFEVVEAINAHMLNADGSLNSVDVALAKEQWQQLKAAYEKIGVRTSVLAAKSGLQDSCFTANPSLTLALPDGDKHVWLARMAHPSRKAESEMHREFFQAAEFEIKQLPEEVERFEGCGDAVLHPGRFLIHGGVGPRTDQRAWMALASAYPELDILTYELVDERFYHLDTALAPLNQNYALYVPEAFTDEGCQLLRAAFPNALALPLEESLRFAANAHCPDGKHVLIEEECRTTCALLEEHGFKPVPVPTSEFRKSGGSVFCLKQSY
ncbi:MAG: amidinotransferase [Planctomycetes bacterium]|nr:amidinotransferase [Planctomycetota bacterium]